MSERASISRATAPLLSAAIAVFAAAFAVYLASPVVTSFDSRWSIYTAWSIIREGNADLDEYRAVLERERFEAVIERNGKHYDFFPVGPALSAVPFLSVFQRFPGVFELLSGRNPDAAQRAKFLKEPYRFKRDIEKIAAGFLTALAAALMVIVAGSRSGIPAALCAGLMLAFCTPAWSLTSRGLWQHAPSILLLTAALAMIASGRITMLKALSLGALLGAAYVVRPTNSISVAFFGAALLIIRARTVPAFALGCALPIIPFVMWSMDTFGAPLPPYYLPERVGSTDGFGWAVLGNLVSPSRGLFVFSPVLACGVIAALARFKAGKISVIEGTLLAVFTGHLLLVSSFPKWWSGHSYGPRFMSDMAPYLVFLTLPVIERMGSRIIAMVMVVLMAISAHMHYHGAFHWSAWRWNVRPVNVDSAPERVWDWRDPQFLR